MTTPPSPPVTFPVKVAGASGIHAEFNANGSLRRMDCGDIMLNLFLGNDVEGGPSNIYLRVLGDHPKAVALLGPTSPASYQNDERGMFAQGTWENLTYRLRFLFSDTAAAWFWHVEIENSGHTPISCDLIHTQDIGLANYGAIRLNEYYVSHYIDHSPLEHATKGCAVASRQNQAMGGRCPWSVIGSLSKGVSYGTDAMQFHGLATRAGEMPPALEAGLPGKRLQHEHSLVCIQDEPFALAPGETTKRGFFGLFVADKPTATSASDAVWIDQALALPEATCPQWPGDLSLRPASPSLFTTAPRLESLDLDEREIEALFGDSLRHVEKQHGEMLSFFTNDHHHVALKAKEEQLLRPHGHIMRSGGSLVPDEAALTSTAWMGGVFHSMLTQGHVSINRFLSTCHTYLGLFRSHGQRVLMQVGETWFLLGTPSAFEMKPDGCRWIYKHHGGLLEVIASAPADRHELGLTVSILEGKSARFLITHHIAMNGDDGSASIPAVWHVDGNAVSIRAIPDSDVGRRFPDGQFVIRASDDTPIQSIGGDECLFNDGMSRQQPFVCLQTTPTKKVSLTVVGQLVAESVVNHADFWENIGAGLKIRDTVSHAPASRVAEIFPWLIQNALIHFLSPRGLEQYSGGGWGTRDVCQGPVELLLALGRFEPVRDILLRVFRQQNADGDWPQWFMFFERERNIRPGDSHGDIVYWPLLALAEYLSATADATLLDETLPYFHSDGDAVAEKASLLDHVERALDVIHTRVIAGTHLAAYGHGDWNDSLQPVKPDMRERLCSSWTVTLNYQTFLALAHAFHRLGNPTRATEFEAMAAHVLKEFQQLLIVDGVLSGLVYFRENGETDYLIHPRDSVTGLSFSILPMIHAIINDMLTPAQAAAHLSIIHDHLTGPDGGRLFDHPLRYHGGPQTYFQRAESASYFGREIGIMYTHAHLRYCEALARYGDADGFFKGLCQFNPILIRQIVPSAAMRQANCYYSSSDAAFADRYAAYDDYDQVNLGTIPLEGGWRVYSSGAGIGVRLIMQCFLGLRVDKHSLIIDPVIPSNMDGMTANLTLAGQPIEIVYQIGPNGCGPLSIDLNGENLTFIRESNPYRLGAARISMEAWNRATNDKANRLVIRLG